LYYGSRKAGLKTSILKHSKTITLPNKVTLDKSLQIIDPMDVPFGLWAQMGLRDHSFDGVQTLPKEPFIRWGPDPHGKGQFCGGKGGSF